MEQIYCEQELENHPRVKRIFQRFPGKKPLFCERYQEVFNLRAQNFRIQKQNPSLILAKKRGSLLQKIPQGYGLGFSKNFYFSHMLNCPFDCRYCFLQGMYRSAHYVFFINLEDFMEKMEEEIEKKEPVYFFSGYDGDSLALEGITHFVESFYPFFVKHPTAHMELRTKSLSIASLLQRKPLANWTIAFTLTPEEIQKALEHKTPSLKKRIEAIQKLSAFGWKIGLRFDPLFFLKDYERIYRSFFEKIFEQIPQKSIEDITMGSFRMPKGVYENMRRIYPEEKLFILGMKEEKKSISYEKTKEEKLINFCYDQVQKYIARGKIFLCPTL